MRCKEAIMQSQRWLESVREQLIARRLPRDYIERFMEELADHFHDLTEENMESANDAIIRLGDPQQVAKAAADEYRRRTFLGRHPVIAFLTFAISPLITLPLLAVGEMIAVYGVLYLVTSAIAAIFHIHDDASAHLGATVDATIQILLPVLFVIIPSLILTAVYSRLARRTASPQTWLIVSCGLIAALASAPIFMCRFDPKRNYDLLGIGAHWPITIMQFVQFALPIVFAAWLSKRRRARERNLVQSESSLRAAA
jgi:hypothetical protein